MDGVVVILHLFVAREEGIVVFLRPPGGHIAILVILRAGGVKGVGDLVADHGAERAEQLLVGHVAVVGAALRECAEDRDGIVRPVIEAVDGRRRSVPFLLVHRLGIFLYALGDIVSPDAPVGLPEGAAVLGSLKVQLLAAVFLPAVGIEAAGLDAFQLLDGFFAGRVGEEVGLFDDPVIGVQDLKHHVVDAVLVLLLEVGPGVKLCHGPHQRSGSRGGEHRLIVEHAACAGDGVVTGITPLIALAVQAARRADRAVYNEIVFDQRQVFIGVQLDQLCKAGWVRDHILLRLGVADGSQFLQDRERALGRLQFIEAVIVEGFLHEVGLLLILIGIQGGGQHGLKSEAVVDLLLRLFLRIAELDQHLVRKLRQRVLFDGAIVGQLFILGRIPEKKAGIRHGEHIFGGILQIRRGPGVKERGKFVLIAGIHEVRAQLVDGTDGLQRRDPLLERRSAQGIAAVPVHHQLEQVVGQTCPSGASPRNIFLTSSTCFRFTSIRVPPKE